MSKYKYLINEMDLNYVLGGGLEPHFRVLFSAIFHGISLGNFYQGRKPRILVEGKLLQIYVQNFSAF